MRPTTIVSETQNISHDKVKPLRKHLKTNFKKLSITKYRTQFMDDKYTTLLINYSKYDDSNQVQRLVNLQIETFLYG